MRTICLRARWRSILTCLAALALGGCSSASYVTPGAGADMSIFGGSKPEPTGNPIEDAFNTRPTTAFPAALAVVRVQSPGYDNHRRYGSYGSGRYSVVNTRDVETDAHFARLRSLPRIAGVAPISSLQLPAKLESSEDLRAAAASLHAELLLVYTIDTRFFTDDLAPPLSFVTLGLFPSKTAQCRTTASCVLLDTRTGFVYAVAQGSGSADQLANGWTSDSAVEDARLRSERRAFETMLAEFENAWPVVVHAHATAHAKAEPESP
ncbi:MAG: hypothetical protein HRU70_05975 [Phycisphaeraceae bacterium]|nr:MAG: hypothetical protein HRU70_05975 [Phycisphaeraceae bacterium]